MADERDSLDLSGVPCPRNTAQALLRLEMMDDGEELAITVDDGEPVDNMIASLELEPDLRILSRDQNGGSWLVVVRKGEAAYGT